MLQFIPIFTLGIKDLNIGDTIITITSDATSMSITDSIISNPIAFFALIISVIAFLFSIVWSILGHRHNIISVKPICHLFFKYVNKSGKFTYTLTNGGVGPAIIKDIYFNYKNSKYRNLREVLDLEVFVVDYQIEKLVTKINMQNVSLSVNETTNLISGTLVHNKEKDNAMLFCNELNKVEVVVIYKSVYGKVFTLKENIDSPYCQ